MNITNYGTVYGRHYIIPDLITKNSLVYSFGIGEDISFDLALIENTGCKVYAFDPTPKSLAWIKQQKLPEGFQFFEYGLSDKDGTLTFEPPPNPNWVSYKESEKGTIVLPVKCLSTIKAELGHVNKQIDFLKLDIEGSEFSVINDILANNLHPVQMSVGFHGTDTYIADWLRANRHLQERYHAYLYSDNEIFFISK